MSWFKVLVVASLLTLAGCGFTPMYGKTDSGPKVVSGFQGIEVENIPNREGQYLRNQLIDRLYTDGKPQNAPYSLRITNLKREIVNFGIRKDATATRGEMQITAHLELVDRSTGATVLSRDMRSVGAYNLLDNQYATLISRDSLTGHVLSEMSDNIITELGLYFRREPGVPVMPDAAPVSVNPAEILQAPQSVP